MTAKVSRHLKSQLLLWCFFFKKIIDKNGLLKNISEQMKPPMLPGFFQENSVPASRLELEMKRSKRNLDQGGSTSLHQIEKRNQRVGCENSNLSQL